MKTIYKQRKLYSDFFKNIIGTALTEIIICSDQIILKTRNKEWSYQWHEIEKAYIETSEITTQYTSVVNKVLVLEAHDREFRINVSNVRAEFEKPAKLVKELRNYIKITTRYRK